MVVLVVRQVVSFAQVYTNGLFTVAKDPIAFHTQVSMGFGPLTRDNYGVVLGSIYQAFGASHLLGCEFSQIAMSLALIVMVELFFRVGLERGAPRLILIFGLLPSMLLNTSVTSREAFQVLFLLSFVLGILSLKQDGVTPTGVLVPAAGLMLGFSHQGFSLLIFILLPVSLLWLARTRPNVLMGGIFFFALIGVLFGGRIYSSLTRSSNVLSKLESGMGLEYIDGYQESVERSRTDFDATLDLSSVGSLMKTGPPVLLNYMFSPLPWQVQGYTDLYGFGESLVRFFLLVGALRMLKKSSGDHRSDLFLLFIMFALVELMWATGTSNWGTAFRHRTVAYGVLVVLGGPFFVRTKLEELEDGASTRPVKKSLRAQIRERRTRSGTRRATLGKKRRRTGQ